MASDTDGARLVALRAALYRPDPPSGAVDAYLDALAAAGPPPEPIAEETRRGPRRRLLGIALLAVALAAAVGATFAVRGAGAPAERTTAARPTATAAATAEPAADATGALPFPSPLGVELGAMSGGPGATSTFDAGRHLVVVSVLCEGSGTMTVRIGADPAVELGCRADQPGLTMLESTGARDRVTVTVAPDPRVSWTLAVGAVPAG